MVVSTTYCDCKGCKNKVNEDGKFFLKDGQYWNPNDGSSDKYISVDLCSEHKHLINPLLEKRKDGDVERFLDSIEKGEIL